MIVAASTAEKFAAIKDKHHRKIQLQKEKSASFASNERRRGEREGPTNQQWPLSSKAVGDDRPKKGDEKEQQLLNPLTVSPATSRRYFRVRSSVIYFHLTSDKGNKRQRG